MPKLHVRQSIIGPENIYKAFEDQEVANKLLNVVLDDAVILILSHVQCGHNECMERAFALVVEGLQEKLLETIQMSNDIAQEVAEERADSLAEGIIDFFKERSKCVDKKPEGC